MRVVLWIMLCCAVCTARAGDVILTKEYRSSSRQQEQLAVVQLDDAGVTVDVFIVIRGLPAGTSTTYRVPFWAEPSDFRVQPMTAASFRRTHLAPVEARLSWEHRRGTRPVLQQWRPSLALVATGVLGPFAPVLAFLALDNLHAGVATQPRQAPSPPVFSSILDALPVTAADVRAVRMLHRAPDADPEHSALLKKYRMPEPPPTEHLATIELRGTGEGAAQGLAYHVRHRWPPGKPGLYRYPLGAPADRACPLTAIELYAVCPQSRFLHVVAPERPQGLLTTPSSWSPEPPSEYGGVPVPADPVITSRLVDIRPYPSIWHRAYAHTSPRHILLGLSGRPYAPAVTAARFLAMPEAMLVLTLFAWLISWLLAGCCFLQRHGTARRPASWIFKMTFSVMSLTLLAGIAFTGLALLGLAVIPRALPPPDLLEESFRAFPDPAALAILTSGTLILLVLGIWRLPRWWPRHGGHVRAAVLAVSLVSALLLLALLFAGTLPNVLNEVLDEVITVLAAGIYIASSGALWVDLLRALNRRVPHCTLVPCWVSATLCFTLLCCVLFGLTAAADYLLAC